MQKVTFDASPKIEINGVVCELNIDSIEVYKKTVELSKRLDKLVENDSGEDNAMDIIKIAKDLVITLAGEKAYSAIFPTDEAKDNWRWHFKACMGMLPVVFESRRAMVEDIARNSVVQSLNAISPEAEESKPKPRRKFSKLFHRI